MAESPFVSYAQNREDVVLSRALASVTVGRYVDVGANDPVDDSVTYAFYQRGWSGITVEPVPEFAARQRRTRPRDILVEAAVTDVAEDHITLHTIADTGLSTLVDEVGEGHRIAGWDVQDIVVETRRLDRLLEEAGWQGLDIHLMVVDTEGAERDVLASVDLSRWRPWILVVEATRPNGTEPTHAGWEHLVLGAGYRFCLFDGLSRFYVSDEKADELGPLLAAPANILDNYVHHRTLELGRERDEALADLRRHDAENEATILQWRAAAVSSWATSSDSWSLEREQELLHQIGQHVNHIQMVDQELVTQRAAFEALRRTLSWRVTKPLRSVRSLRRGAQASGE